MSLTKKKLKNFLSSPVKNGYSPVCVDTPTSKKILGLGALTGIGLNTAATKWVPESNEQVINFMIQAGDFLVSRSNTLDKVGRAALYRGGLENCSYPDLMMRFRVDESKINPDFLELVLQSFPARKHFMRSASGTSGSMAKITKPAVESLEIPSLPLTIQERAVNAAHIWQGAIDKSERLIATKAKRYQYLLTRFVNDTSYPHGHVRDFTTEVSTRNRSNQCERVLSVTNTNGFVLPEDQFERRVASANLSNYKILEQGQYAYNPSRINVGSIARLNNWDEGVLSPMYVVFKLDGKKVNSDFFLHWLSSHEARERIKRSAQGSVRETVSFADLGAIPFPLPDMDIQSSVVEVLNTAKREIDLLKQLAEQYRIQKRGLMQKLLTGEWRVNTDKEIA